MKIADGRFSIHSQCIKGVPQMQHPFLIDDEKRELLSSNLHIKIEMVFKLREKPNEMIDTRRCHSRNRFFGGFEREREKK